MTDESTTRGEVAIRTRAMPADTNPAGDVWGGWLLSQMDLAGEVVARQRAGRRIATVGVEAMSFHAPVKVGDVVSFYCEIVRIGTTSLTVEIVAVAMDEETANEVRVTEGRFTFVALGDDGRPSPIAPER